MNGEPLGLVEADAVTAVGENLQRAATDSADARKASRKLGETP